ncbi:aminopeptidase-like protein [Tribolium castaneum]|uniref:Aminopeptidase-like protein n=1 Tax=Tribolium castaneum TaxID=7070 RepID=D6WCL5_TRICA|nr:PREDICTED: aminopeptidase N [Tribolium castaneum]EEZ99313.2 aminopeptidase-like protein [Tribolium castaneum]|eukprot:XP_008190382.2 PREDICTED: aminopeptidase N [Tribolium castaneum]
MGRGGVGSTRSEFLAEDSVDDIRYHRNGGCFVTTKRAIAFVLVAVVSLLLVVILMYYYGPSRKLEALQDDMKDIEELINKTINEEPEENIRLPTNLKPLHYRLRIFPILDEFSPDNFTYSGEVKIIIRCLTKTNKIVLNLEDLEVSEHNVTVSTLKTTILRYESLDKESDKDQPEMYQKNSTHNSSVIIVESENNSTDEILIGAEAKSLMIQEVYKEENYKLYITMKNLLEAGHNYTINIKFSGNITNNLAGFYRTSYKDLSGQRKWLATTYFQPIFARRVFPCFDEPNFKSSFEISIARRTNMTVRSNMPLRETEPIAEKPGWVWDHFEKSLPMPTYLVSFTVCDFHNLHLNSSETGPVINLWAPQSDLPKAKYALEAAQSILIFLEDYLGIKYPLPKIDLLAVPNFARGSMGSWGILSFQKSSILLEEHSRNWELKQHIFIALAHELAHQWFGNLVTMKWWNDLWLNEGIGSFMAEVVQTSLKPRWQSSNDFPVRVMYKSFSLDSLKSTHPIQTDFTKTVQIEQIFDTIIQSKGTSLIRMLNYTLSRGVFRQGLQYYLNSLSYKSTDQDSLWKSLTEIAKNSSVLPDDVTVKSFMESWTKQKGYPYVTVDRNYDTGEAVITQQIFIQDNVNNNTLWFIPLSFTTTDDVIHNAWLKNERNTTLNITSPGNTSWVLFNIDQAGYFRVNYDIHNWNLLIRQLFLNPSEIPVASRSQLIDDAFELAQMEILNYSIPLRLTKYLTWKESNYIPWTTALNSLEEIRFIINNYEYTGAFETYMTHLIRHKFDSLGTREKPGEPQNDKILRWRLTKIACELRYEPCIRWAQKEFYAWMENADPDAKNPIPFEYRSTVQCIGIKTGSLKEWDFLWNRTLEPQISPADLKTAYLSLGCTHDPWLINRYLELSLSGNITLEYIPYVWQSINHFVGIRTGFHFLRLNWERVYSTYEDVDLVLNSICQDFLSYLSTEIDLQDLTQFYKIHQKDLKSVAPLMQAAVDSIKIRISWRERHLNSVVAWLTNK